MRSSEKGAEYAAVRYEGRVDTDPAYYRTKPERIRIEKILKCVGHGNRVLDIGCYDGSIGRRLIEGGNEVAGVEASKRLVEIARQVGIDATLGNIEEGLAFPDSRFDVVLVGEVIEHVLDTDMLMNEIRRILTQSGKLVLTTPNVASLGRRLLLLAGRNPYFEASLGFPPKATAGHIRFFTRDLLIQFLTYKHFQILEYTSDVVNFTSSGRGCSKLLADLCPTLGRSLIVKAEKEE